jgi:hypothetical protein
MGIALQCNTVYTTQESSNPVVERRRRCWAGILMLHTYQAVLFKDIDLSSLLHTPAVLALDIDNTYPEDYCITKQSSESIGICVMKFKIRLFRLSNRICRELAKGGQFNETKLDDFDSQVARECKAWDAAFLVHGLPSILEPSTYGHWCILQVYAHQLYLLLHRPFCQARSSNKSRYRPSSRSRCMASGAALLDLQHQFPVYGLIAGCVMACLDFVPYMEL